MRDFTGKPYSTKGGVLTTQILEMGFAKMTGNYERVLKWEVSDWLSYEDIPSKFAHLPNAIAAQEIMNSLLYSALSEENE